MIILFVVAVDAVEHIIFNGDDYYGDDGDHDTAATRKRFTIKIYSMKMIEVMNVNGGDDGDLMVMIKC